MGDSTQYAESKKVELDPTVDFVAGTVAGMAGLVVGFPFDTIKVRFQDPANIGRYTSTFNALTKIVREEKVSGLFKGITAPMAGCAFLNGLIFASYGFLMRIQLQHPDDRPTLSQIGLAGAGTGMIASVITCPTELVKIKQQRLADAKKVVPTSSKLALDILRKQGVKGLYRGVTVTAMRDVGYGIYFATYEGVSSLFRRSNNGDDHFDHTSLAQGADADIQSVPWYGLLLAGGMAGVASWIPIFPFDVIKTQMQSTRTNGERSNTWDNFIKCYRTFGAKGFFVGLAPTVIRAIPVNMVTFATFEMAVGSITKGSPF